MEGSGKKLIVVCGPTAGGKSDFALALSHAFGGEMVAADSMQIYRGLAVGTAALLPEEAGGIPQHCVGFLPPEVSYSAAEYVADARRAMGSIWARGRLPVVCGGTGLYVRALVEGVAFSEEKPSPALRAQLQADWEAQGPDAMLARLAQCDAAHADRLHLRDKKRILRALELCETTGLTEAERAALSRAAAPPYTSLCIGLMPATREQLYVRINARAEHMLQNGLLEEARLVYQNRDSYKTAAQAIGYKEFFPYFEGTSTLENCAEKLRQATRNYAKRQLTWFRHMPQLHWLDAADPTALPTAEKWIRAFLADGALPLLEKPV